MQYYYKKAHPTLCVLAIKQNKIKKNKDFDKKKLGEVLNCYSFLDSENQQNKNN